MYKRFYVEASSDDQRRARRTECAALDIVITKLTTARNAGGSGASLTDALDALEALWVIFVSDVSNSDNALPPPLRSNILSLGRWMFSRSAALRNAEEVNLDSLIEVNIAIRDGLKATQ